MGKPYDNALALSARISVCSLLAEAIVNRVRQPDTSISRSSCAKRSVKREGQRSSDGL